MHILLVADGRSPISKNWINAVLSLGHKVSLISTYPCEFQAGLENQVVLPIAFSKFAGSQAGARWKPRRTGILQQTVSHFRSAFLGLRYRLGPLSLPLYARRYKQLVKEFSPDIVHALRIPYEGMLAAHTPKSIPLVVSIWGNDLTLHAQGSRSMSLATKSTLARADGLLADAARDLRLSAEWGFEKRKPAAVIPGGAGVDLGEITNLRQNTSELNLYNIPAGVPVIVNPRGFRPGSVRNDIFFQSIPLVLERSPNALFICPGMAGQPEALQWLDRLRIHGRVKLLPYLAQSDLWQVFLKTDLFISISEHDGTPNSLLEAMACGCFPICGDIESLREWITPGNNGMLVDPTDPGKLSEAIIAALSDHKLRASAAKNNLGIIRDRAEISVVRFRINDFYQMISGGDLSAS